MSDYTFSRINAGNFSDLVQLMDTVNETPADVVRLRQKYDTAKFGAQDLGYLAYKNGDSVAAAYYGVFPLRLSLNGEVILAAQSGDTMTHPLHRGKGLFIELAKKTYALAKAEGVKFVFGFPNSNSYPGFVKKLGWKHPYNMISLNIFSATLPLNLLAKKIPFVARLQEKWLNTLLQLFFKKNELYPGPYSSVTSSGAAGVLRNHAFLDYKKNCGQSFQSGQAFFFVKYDGDINIGDVVDLGNGTDARRMIRKLRWVAAFSGIARTKTFCSPESKLASILADCSLRRDSLAYGYVPFDEIPGLDKIQFTYIDYDTF